MILTHPHTSRTASLLLALTLVATAGCSVNKKHLRNIGAAIAIGVAAKLIYDMVIEYQSEQVSAEGEVLAAYRKTHASLPKQPLLLNYQTSLKPGDVVSTGEAISIVSSLEVIRGAASERVDIQEQIAIFDNEDNTKVLKTLTKVVNAQTRTGGRFKNSFTFKLPKGMPQGIYPVETTVIVNGQEFTPVNNRMQLVLNRRTNYSAAPSAVVR